MDDYQWEVLLERIAEQTRRAVPRRRRLGGRARRPGWIAEKWAAEYEYPLSDTRDLARVSQFLAVKPDGMAPKETTGGCRSNAAQPAVHAGDELHGVLAQLPLPLYLTTNYDSFMAQALAEFDRPPEVEY